MRPMGAERKAAIEAGLKQYFTGKPCRNGHTAPRLVRGYRCTECEWTWHQDNPGRVKAGRESYYRRNRDKIIAAHYARRGMPTPTRPCPDQCESCGGTQKRRLCLDHCHETGKFRGWLCFKCNSSIGKLGDNIAGVGQAMAYLARALLS